MREFTLDDEQLAKIGTWLTEQREIELTKQLKNCRDCKGDIRCIRHVCGPYHGACGGAVTYSFTPTSLGIVTTVHHAGTDAKLDVSDYDAW